MIYIPDLDNYKCFVVRSDSIIRAYKQVPQNGKEIEYRDYYYNANYLYQDGVQSFSNYSTLPVCLDNSNLSTDYVYRNDYPQILLSFFILSLILIYIPFKIISRMCGRWLRI